MSYLQALDYRPTSEISSTFPFNLPILAGGCHIRFPSSVTLIVGENGSGKSTLLEALAIAVSLPTVGAANADMDPTLTFQKDLGRALKLTWSRKTRRGFFLRAEDFFNFCKGLRATREEYELRFREIDEEYADRSDYARSMAKMPFARSLYEMRALYGEDLDAMSHGESFLKLFSSRLAAGGLFILDEPEAPLSPLRQLALIHMIRETESNGAQFVIATHSPILMAYPGATLYAIENGNIRETSWETFEHVQLMCDFLQNPTAFLRQL